MATEPFAQATVDEAALDPYVVRERPVLDFLTDQARRAPWWTISLLVHLIALLVLWRWPIRNVAGDTFSAIKVEIYKPTPDEVDKPKKEEPDLPPDPSDDLPFVDEPNIVLEQPKPNIDTEFMEDPPEVAFDTIEPVQEIARPPIMILTADNLPPMYSRKIFGKRGDLNRLTRGGPGGTGTGPPGHYGANEIMLGLIWLAKAQSRDGSWDAKAWGGARPYNVGMTGLAMLAFHGAGYTTRRGSRFRETVRRGLRWLATHQRPDGSFPWTTFYEQGIATMAVAEAYAMTGEPAVGRMAQRAVTYVCTVQPDHGGYRYGGAVPRGDGDMSVTGWQIMAIKSAQCAETLDVPDHALERARTFLRNAKRNYGTSSYIVASPSPGSLAVTSIGMICRIFVEHEGEFDQEINGAATTLVQKETDGGKIIYGGSTKELTKNLYYTYYSALAMYQVSEEHWRIWRKTYYDALRTAIVRQKFDQGGRYIRGSWAPAKYKWAKQGGRVYSTAMAVLSLEVPFRYLRVYRRER
ncbi:prenyltransferase/squalene oxidase repeat-containing protein [Planctomycetota bacterium]